MTNTTVRYGALGALLTCFIACSEVNPPTAPILRAPTSTSPPDQIPTFPAVLRPARIYVHLNAAAPSRFVFYDDGTFVLQYATFNNRSLEYPGTYSTDGTNISLDFGMARAATGTLTDDSFTVKYNDIMQHSDFQDAVYTRDR